MLAEMGAYLQKHRRPQIDSIERACQDARDALYRTGVITTDGKLKDIIVSV